LSYCCAGYDQNGDWNDASFSGFWVQNPSFQPVMAQGSVWDLLYGAFSGWARSIGGTPAATGDPRYDAFVAQQTQPKTIMEAKGMMIGPFLGFLIPGFGEEEVGMEGIEAAEEAADIERLLESVQQHGRTITFATLGSEELRYLDYMGAEANVGGPGHLNILLRENPSKEAILEEFLHGTQDRLGIIDRLGENGAEDHVKNFMTRHRKMLGLP